MSARLANKICIVAGAGQTPGETIGNGRAIALRFAQEGAEILCVDRDLERARETVAMIAAAGGIAFAHQADVFVADECQAVIGAAVARGGRIDVLVNNVGIGGGDAPAHVASEPVWDRITPTGSLADLHKRIP